MEIGAEPRYPTPVYVKRGEARLAPDTGAHTREKSLNFFAFRQKQMGNWPINCCDDLGLPISAGSSTIPEPVQARTAPDVCIRAIGETTLRPLRLEKLSDKQITWQVPEISEPVGWSSV